MIHKYTFVLIAIAAMFCCLVTSAQERQPKSGDPYAAPWVWLVGVVVFILLLVALLRDSPKKDV